MPADRAAALRLCFFGDSFVCGYGDPDARGWVGRACAPHLAAGRDLTLYNLGIRGATIGDVALSWENEAVARLPLPGQGRVLFSFGANDAVQDVPPASSLDHAAAILKKAIPRAPVLVIGPAPIADDPAADARAAALCPALDSLCRTMAVPFLSIHSLLRQSDAWMNEALAGDGAHPGRAGYAALAALIRGWSAWHRWLA